jgi:3-hydroxyacyl-CoA dehydrogenase/enoyl-CoA hydratase/3-hydroxybutyryl-CoA epimerase
VRAGVENGVAAGLAAERTAFLELIPSREARARIHLFTAEADIKRRSKTSTAPVETLAVIGGGQMGSGIAATAVSRGLRAVVRDVTDEKLEGARAYLTRVLTRAEPDETRAAQRQAAWSGTTEWVGFDSASAVIEAVFELPELKRETLSAVSAVVSPGTLIATNTSAIPVGSLAGSLTHPELFIGMHFFSPVDRMPLVELVPHSGTAVGTIDRASGLARQLGKVPVVVADFPGFFTSRVYARWLIEGVRLLLDGVEPAQIERGAALAGFPVGPLQACDEATLDLVVKASITQVAEKVMSDRLDIAAARAALERLIAGGIEGRRQGRGFYLYENGKRTGLNPAVPSLVAATPASLPDDVVRDRLLLAFASECFLSWDDGTLCHPDDGDVASVLGIGFPRALGGPFHWADSAGLEWVVERAAELGTQAFPVGSTLPALSAAGGFFATSARRPTPASAS